MTQYIDKNALVAEIERRKEINKYRDTNDSLFEDEAIISFLNTLEVKEVDTEKECEDLRDGGICNFATTKLGKTVRCENISCSRRLSTERRII